MPSLWGAVVTAAIMYLLYWAVLSLFKGRTSLNVEHVEPVRRFALIVPAYNEENGIERTVRSLLALKYPQNLFDVVVVADNCTDDTATVAQKSGASVLIRNNPDLRGKGYALKYAFEELLERNFDAFVIVDADTVADDQCLLTLHRCLDQGQQVVQLWYGVNNPDESMLSYLQHVGNCIENRLFHLPKSRVGLPTILRGNGMCFSCDVLRDNPWDAFSVVEDTEYGLALLEKGVDVHFCDESGVYADFPTTYEQLRMQRVRWASGNSSILKQRAVAYLWQGLLKRNPKLFDMGVSLFVSSRPMMLVASIIPAVFGLVISGGEFLVWWSLALVMAQVLYFLAGIVIAGLSVRRAYHLAGIPFFILWMCGVLVAGLAGYKKNVWVRTKRA